ncbi:MAG TPA: hypothetical protein VF177_20505 [Anaerolineae bacterium]
MTMKQSDEFEPKQSGYGVASLALFVVSLLIFVVTSTLFDASLGGLPLSTQRWIGFLTLVLPATIGVLLGIVGLFQTGRKRSLSLIALMLNAIFALFFTAVLSFAG